MTQLPSIWCSCIYMIADEIFRWTFHFPTQFMFKFFNKSWIFVKLMFNPIFLPVYIPPSHISQHWTIDRDSQHWSQSLFLCLSFRSVAWVISKDECKWEVTWAKSNKSLTILRHLQHVNRFVFNYSSLPAIRDRMSIC